MPKTFNKILRFWFIWLVVILLVVAVAPLFLIYKPTFPNSQQLVASNLPRIIYSGANFDGVHYLTIINKGYIGTGLIQAFFPVYPFLVRGLNYIVGQPIVAGIIISNLSLLGALCYGYLISKDLFSEKSGWQFVFIMLTFPTSFFFTGVYTEPLFLLVLMAGYYHYRTQKKTFLTGLIGLASGVRLVGLTFLPGLLVELLQENKFFTNTVSGGLSKTLGSLKTLWLEYRKTFLFIAVGLIPLLIFIYFLWNEFNDPLYFFSVQSEFGAGRQETIILLPQVIWRSLKILITARPFNFKYFAYVQEFVISLLVLLAIVTSYKKLPTSLWSFSLLAYLLPTLTGSFSSMPRYVLVLFPVWMWWGHYLSQHHKIKWWYYGLSVILLVINTMLFVQGYWVG